MTEEIQDIKEIELCKSPYCKFTRFIYVGEELLGVESFYLEGNSFHMLQHCRENFEVHLSADYYFKHWGDIVELQTPSGVILFSGEDWSDFLEIVEDFLGRDNYWLMYTFL